MNNDDVLVIVYNLRPSDVKKYSSKATYCDHCRLWSKVFSCTCI